MPLVYVLNRGGHDYSAARRFGELVFCTEGNLAKYDTGQMFRELSDAMFDSEENDYILLTSLTTLCSVASAIFAQKHGRINFLIFKDDDYVERKIILNNRDKEQHATSQRG